MAVPRARLLDLMKVQCEIFSTTFNPNGVRMGNNVLRQRLRGPTMVKYYPPRGPSLRTLFKEVKSLELEGIDEKWEDWQESLAGRHQRGKAQPKKKRTAPGPAHGKK